MLKVPISLPFERGLEGLERAQLGSGLLGCLASLHCKMRSQSLDMVVLHVGVRTAETLHGLGQRVRWLRWGCGRRRGRLLLFGRGCFSGLLRLGGVFLASSALLGGGLLSIFLSALLQLFLLLLILCRFLFLNRIYLPQLRVLVGPNEPGSLGNRRLPGNHREKSDSYREAPEFHF